uniref:5'-deoxynucleotidase HDDC2 n=1 Tax=Trichobilharzia regenti TaxID=157069 RepID=A0AA85ISL7_TRIRE|nr:unnamed protein product [Trichobilharzia regenti]
MLIGNLFSRMCNSNILQFLLLCGKLKRTVRTGWTRYNINAPESVSDHMYRMALMASVIPRKERENLNTDRLIKMAIVHDLAECIVGDITPYCGVSKGEKLSRETDAMKHLCSLISEENGTEILNLWKEYSEQKTPEAIICKDFDKYVQFHKYYANKTVRIRTDLKCCYKPMNMKVRHVNQENWNHFLRIL